jgi:hypothetical protein
MKTKMTQTQELLSHLMAGRSITQRDAMQFLTTSIAALPRRIADLKEMGYPIITLFEKNKFTGRRYARYMIDPEFFDIEKLA